MVCGRVRLGFAEFSGGTVYFRLAEFSGGTVSFSGAQFSGGTVPWSRLANGPLMARRRVTAIRRRRPSVRKSLPAWALWWERVTGIEPALSAWEADVLPLNYTRSNARPSTTCR